MLEKIILNNRAFFSIQNKVYYVSRSNRYTMFSLQHTEGLFLFPVILLTLAKRAAIILQQEMQIKDGDNEKYEI